MRFIGSLLRVHDCTSACLLGLLILVRFIDPPCGISTLNLEFENNKSYNRSVAAQDFVNFDLVCVSHVVKVAEAVKNFRDLKLCT